MKKSKTQIIISICSIAIILIALLFSILQAVGVLTVLAHPIITFIILLFGGLGIETLVLGIVKKSTWFFFLSIIMLSLVILYLLIKYVSVLVGIISTVAFIAIAAVTCVLICGNKTESIALNKDPAYKDYNQRKAEKEEAERNAPKEELPEIKSFK